MAPSVYKKRSLKVLHIVPTYVPAWRYGGPIVAVHGLCRALVKEGHDVHVFTTNLDGYDVLKVQLECPVKVDGVQVWYFPLSWPKRFYFSIPMAKALSLSTQKFNLVHIHSIFNWPAHAAARAAHKLKIPYVVSPRGMLDRDLFQRRNRILKLLYLYGGGRRDFQEASAIHVTSQLEAQKVNQFSLNLKRLLIVPNGIDDGLYEQAQKHPFSKEKEKDPRIHTLLFLGRLNWKKGIDRLIQALPFILNARLIIAGNDEEGYGPRLQNLAKTEGVVDRVFFQGPVYGEEKVALLRSVTLFVLPSCSENFGNSVLEAMILDCPVAVTPQVGLAQWIEEHQTGWVLKGKTAAEIGEELNEILENRELMQIRKQRARELAGKTFIWKGIVAQITDLYSEILNNRENSGCFQNQIAEWRNDH